MASQDHELDRLKEMHPEWIFWKARAGGVCATRNRDLSNAEIYAGLAMTLISMRHFADLATQLAEQDRIESSLTGA
jgi:hypothetical protein